MPLKRKSRIRRRVFINTPVIIEKYFLTPSECCSVLGIETVTLARWRKTWANGQQGIGPEPVRFGPGTIRYRIDECIIPSETQPDFLTRMRQRLADDIAAEQDRTSKGASA
jgi:hypothetical protein